MAKRIKHASIGANLRGLGLLPKGYKLSSLTKNQKDRIRKIANRLPGPAFRPQDFVAKKVSHSTAQKLRAAGYRVKQHTAVLETHGADKVTIKGKKIIRESGGKARRITYITPPGGVFKQAEEFFKHRKPGQALMIRVDDKTSIGTIFRSLNDFYRYKEYLDRKYGKAKTDELFSHMYVVEQQGDLSPELPVRRRRRGRTIYHGGKTVHHAKKK